VKRRAAAVALVPALLLAGIVWFFATQGAGRPVTVTAGSARHIVTLTIGSPRDGNRALTVRVTDRAGTPAAAPAVPFTAVLPTMGYSTPVMSAVATPAAGHFTADGVELTAPGIWQFRFLLRDFAGADPVTIPVSITG
jgi:hypothetical protein